MPPSGSYASTDALYNDTPARYSPRLLAFSSLPIRPYNFMSRVTPTTTDFSIPFFHLDNRSVYFSDGLLMILFGQINELDGLWIIIDRISSGSRDIILIMKLILCHRLFQYILYRAATEIKVTFGNTCWFNFSLLHCEI